MKPSLLHQLIKVEELAKSVDFNLQALKSSNVGCHTRDMEVSLQKFSALSSQCRFSTQDGLGAILDGPNSSSGRDQIESKMDEMDDDFAGYLHLQKNLNELHVSNPDLFPRLEVSLKDETSDGTGKRIKFVWDNRPVVGWRQQIRLKLVGKSRGKLEVGYSSMTTNKGKKYRNIDELSTVLRESGQFHLKDKFEFQAVYCVCQTPEEPTRPFLECAYGQCGCNAWVHPECVGLGTRSEEELQKMSTIICPFCSFFLEGSSQLVKQSKNVKSRKTLTPGFIFNDTMVHEFAVEESNMPHHTWGLEGSGCSFKSKASLFRPVLDKGNVAIKLIANKQALESLMAAPIKYSLKPYTQKSVLISTSSAFGRSKKRSNANVSSKTKPDMKASIEMINEIGIADNHDEQITFQEKRRGIILPSGQNIVVGVCGGFIGSIEHGGFLAIQNRIDDMVQSTHEFSRTPSVENSFFCQENANLCGRFLSRPRKKKSGQRTTALEGGESAGFLSFSSAIDGVMRIFALSGNQFPKSIHSWFTSMKYCGFCLSPIDGDENQNYAVGALHYDLHKHCHYLIEKKVFLEVDHNEQNSTEDIMIGDKRDVSTIGNKERCPISIGSSISSDHLYCYEQVDDGVGCNLCGHSGGVLVWFQISEQLAASPPLEGGWLGHVPCIEFLLRGNLLKPLNKSSAENNSLMDEWKSSFLDVNSCFEKDLLSAKSMFDLLMGSSRCRLCGLNDGITMRCCSIGCTARAHPLCCSISEGWDIVELELEGSRSLGLVCCMHD